MKRRVPEIAEDDDASITDYSTGELIQVLIQRLDDSNGLMFVSYDLRLKLIRRLSKNVSFES